MNLVESYDEYFYENETNNKSIKDAYLYLKMSNLVFPGSIIPGEQIEQALKIKYEKDSWKFLGPLLELKACFEEDSFFTTCAGLNAPSMRILSTEEMADHAHKKIKRNTLQNCKISDIMLGHDITKLDESKQKKHNFIQRKVAEMAIFQQKVLHKRIFV